MLTLESSPSAALIPMSATEQTLYEQVVPQDHFLRRLSQAIDFELFRPQLTAAYCPNNGRPPLDPVILLKLELLARQYRLSDREVIAGARFNIAYRLFLGLSLTSPVPHPTSLTYFRERLTAQGLQQVFDALVGQARRLGLVKDRLRLKDATHVIASIAIPSTIRLVAQARDQLLKVLRPLAPQQVAEEEQQAEAIRRGTAEARDEERLLQRVTHLRTILAWADDLPGQEAFQHQSDQVQQRLQAALALAHKILGDRAQPKAKDQVLSVQDPDARRGMHGGYYEGYLLDIAMDADSEIITAVNVLPANGDEGADTATLIRQEEQAQGNDVAGVSVDGAGFRGTVLRELTDPHGLNLEVFTPPSATPPAPGFAAEQFTLTEVGGRPTLTCPAGQTTQSRDRNEDNTAWRYRFDKAQCSGCPLRDQCLVKPNAQRRVVVKNDYEGEYAAARAKAQTPEYAEVRRRHPAIERKLSELVGRHEARRARYRGQRRVLYQGLMTSLVVNLKRIVRLLFAPGEAAAPRVRAALGAGS